MIDRAHDLGLTGCCITDHESLSGHIKALKHLKQRQKDNPNDEIWKNFKMGLGNEIYLCRNNLNADEYQKGEKFPHFILVAKDKEGHKQLRKLSSRAWSHSFTMFMTRVPTYYQDIEEIVGANPGHIVASSACIGGYLGICYEKKLEKEAYDFIEWCKKIFKDDFYLEIQPARYKEQIEYNKWLLDISRQVNVKCIITTDSHYLKKEDREVHSAFLNSKDGDRETAEFYQYTYMMGPEEIKELVEDYINEQTLQELFNNTNEIRDKIESYDLSKAQIVPHLKDDRETIKWKEWLNRVKIQEKYEYLNKYLKS